MPNAATCAGAMARQKRDFRRGKKKRVGQERFQGNVNIQETEQ